MLGSVMTVTLSLFIGPMQDPDFWWHLRVGRWMVDNGRLPSQDLFTYTVSNHAWTDHEYLTEILIWLVYSNFGIATLCILFGLVTWAGFWILYRQVRKRPFVIAGLGLTLAAIAGAPIWGPRAQMITFAFTCLELYWLNGYLSGRSRAIYFFPLLMVLWANLHGGWVIGFAWLGVALVSEAIGWALNRSDHAKIAHLKKLAIITIASGVAVLATPHGPGLYLYPFETQGSIAQQKLIIEWFSPDFHQTFLRPFEAMFFLAIIGFVLHRPRIYDVLLVLTALGLSLQSVRHIALFIAAATPVLIASYSDWWREFAAARSWKPALPPRVLFTGITLFMLVLIAAATLLRISTNLNKQDSLDRSSYPIAAADWLAAHPEVGTRMYNQYGWGGYLADRFYPEPNRRVFIFGEAALMGDDLLNQYEDVQTLRPDWQAVLDRNGVDYIVYNRDEALTDVLATEPQWTCVHEDSVAVIYERSAPGVVNSCGTP